MRLFLIDVHGRYMNPTNSYIPALLRLEHDVVMYGPGLCSEADLREGIERFAERHGEFDFIVSSLHEWTLREADIAFFQSYIHPHQSSETLQRFGVEADKFLKQSNIPKIVFLTRRDTYSISDEAVDQMKSFGAHYVGWAQGFYTPQRELHGVEQESFYEKKNKIRRLGIWHDFVSQNSEMFINFGHFIGEGEFDWNPIGGRPTLAAVPGVSYHRRGSTKKALIQAGLIKHKRRLNFFALADRAGLRPYARPIWQNYFNARFVRQIVDARYAYTDGSRFDALVRKFFEIPALGTVLICTPCTGLGDVGFADKKNAVFSSPETVVEAVRWLESNPGLAQEIATAGRDLVWRQHSLHARARQFTDCLTAIKAGRFRGSRWQAGEFVVQTANEAAVAG